jgi:hypothetical protein
LAATLQRLDGGPSVPATFAPTGRPGAYAAQLDLPERGAYRLRVGASDAQGLLETRELLLETGAGGAEGSRAAVNRPYLEQLAEKTGGLVVGPEQAGELAAAVLRGVKAEVRRRETSLLWDSPYFFLLFAGLLTAEWLLRRKMNLV